jgi:hypothetical protein
MDWDAAIERNREALKRVLAMLVAMAELATGHRQSETSALASTADCRLPITLTLPRHLHRTILRLLRPAEAAARRLVIVAARGLVVASPRPRNPRPRRSVPRNGVSRPLAFRLFDPLPRRRRRRPTPSGVPRIWFPGSSDPFPVPRPPSPFDAIDATRIALRLAALSRALGDLPCQARRFARWRARLNADRAPLRQTRKPGRIRRIWPLRPGRPPGHHAARGRRTAHEIHAILNEIHGLAIWALEAPDTS